MHRRFLLHPASLRALSAGLALAAALVAAGCGNDAVTSTPTGPTATAVTETFDGTLTVNGARTHPFTVQQTGGITVTLAAIEPSDAVIGLSLGTWNGTTCAIGGGALANDNAASGAVVTGAASATGNYCARVYDVGKLTQAVSYQIAVVHY